MKTIFSGIMPSGNLHIGNYLGAIKQWVELQKTYHVFVMIADLHAITTPQEPKELYARTLELAALLLSAGIDPKKSKLFLQSHVPAHTELGWILNTITPLGELERMTQFKEKSDKAGAFAGLLNYPTLQAADILLYQPSVVPVGEDQLQHLELTRMLARKFNTRYGKTFIIPLSLAGSGHTRIMGLDDPTKKMSKSAQNTNNYIALLDTPDEIRRKIKRAVTDSGKEIVFAPSQKPAISNLITIMSALRGNKKYAEIVDEYRGKGYADFKTELAELIIEKLTPIQKIYSETLKNKKLIIDVLQKGAKEANTVANHTLLMVKEKMGFVLF